MKINIYGYDAVENGLHAGGIERLVCHVTGEPLHNAEQAICEGSFFASEHHKTASIIYEKDIESLGYLREKREKQNAGLEIIVLGKELNAELLAQLSDLNLPLLVAENVKDIYKMIADAVAYSELKLSPVVVYIPVRLLRFRKAVTMDGRYYCDDRDNIDMDERNAGISALEKRYNRIYDVSHSKADAGDKKANETEDAQDGKTLIIAVSGCAGTVCEIAAQYRKVYMCKLDMPFADTVRPLFSLFRHYIIIGHGALYVKKMLSQKGLTSNAIECIELSHDKPREICEISTALRESLSGQCANNNCTYASIKATGALFTNMMCAECPYRDEIRSIMRQYPDISVYEDIYCRKRGTMVHSGISGAPSAYVAKLVITNRKEISSHIPGARYINLECAL